MVSGRTRGLAFLIIGVLFLVAGGVLGYKLFEPVFVYNAGWKPFSPEAEPPARFETPGLTYAQSGLLAEQAMLQARTADRHPGLSAAVAVDGRLVWRGVVGRADLAEATPLSFTHAFRLGSSSKAVTAVAVGTQIDKGVLSLETPLRKLDPTLPARFDRITLGQAMSHRAGVRNYALCFCFPVWEHLNRRRFDSVREAVGVIENDAPLSEPGAAFAYTSLGYNLAGLAVERAGRTSFGATLQRDVFGPLGMSQTRLDTGPTGGPGAATWYEVEPRGYKPAWTVDNSLRFPSGGMLSTPSDMVSLGSAMLDDRLLSSKTRAALVQVPTAGRENGGEIYAHGWRVGDWSLPDGRTVTAWHHNGVSVGSRSIFVVFPKERVVVSVMTNKGADDLDDLSPLADVIAQAFMAGPESR